MAFTNCYDDKVYAEAYSNLEFANTYYLAFRDLPAIFSKQISGTRALDFGCGTGRSTRFLQRLGFHVIGVDIASKMISKARELDRAGDYRLIENDDFSALHGAAFDLVLSAFTFDNIPGWQTKVHLFRELGALLKPSGRIVSIVSTPEIYTHEWASFSTKNYPENLCAKTGDVVRIVTTEFLDASPAEDVLWTHEAYAEVYSRAGLEIIEYAKPLATGNEPYHWVNETAIAPWAIYILGTSTSDSRGVNSAL